MYLVAGIATLFGAAAFETLLLVPSGVDAGAGSLTHGLVLSAHVLAWALVAGSTTAWTARLLGLRGEVGRGAQLLFLLGAAGAAALQLAIHEYGRARFGYFEPTQIGLTALLPAALVGHLTFWLAVLVSQGRVASAWVALAISSLFELIIFAGNLPGIRDGISAGSLPLAGAMGFAGLLLVSTWLIPWQRSRHRASLLQG
jgi:hypothetical protein